MSSKIYGEFFQILLINIKLFAGFKNIAELQSTGLWKQSNDTMVFKGESQAPFFIFINGSVLSLLKRDFL